MRLAYLVSQYPAINHTFILREIRTLRDQGFDIEVISIRPPDRPLDKMSPEEREEAERTWPVLPQGIRILGANVAVFFSSPWRYGKALWSAAALSGLDLRAMARNFVYFAEAITAGRRMQSRGIAHLHTHFSSTVALLLARAFPITYSATIHGPEEFDNGPGFHLGAKVAEARFLCTISYYARSQLMRASHPRHWDKIEVSPLGVDPDIFTPRPHRAAPERFEILSVGRLAPVKAFPVLIEAVSLLVAQGRDSVRLRIAGGGADFQELQELIAARRLQEHVRLEGPCNQERIRELYGETDLFALASFAEGVPVVLMEAMAKEIPCVATCITGIPELIRHGEEGWLVPPSDARLIAEAIAHLMDDPPLRQRLGRAARLRVRESYNLAVNTRRLGEIFARRLNGR